MISTNAKMDFILAKMLDKNASILLVLSSAFARQDISEAASSASSPSALLSATFRSLTSLPVLPPSANSRAQKASAAFPAKLRANATGVGNGLPVPISSSAMISTNAQKV